MDTKKFETIAKLLRYYSLLATTTASSGHPTSALSAADIMAVLYFNFLKYDFENPHNKYNDRLIFSKGHATPLLYALYKVAGKITEEELLKYRTLVSPLQGHPTPQTPYVDVATGSLGMGLSFGFGMALASQLDKIDNTVYVLLGDGEMAEGNVWEALECAAYYKTNNLVGIIDVNGLGETGPTMLFHDIKTYQKRSESFGWNTIGIDGHNYTEIESALEKAQQKNDKPTMIIANTLKGKGISFLEGKEGKHGKALKQDEYEKAIAELAITNEEKNHIFPVAKPEKNELIETKKATPLSTEQIKKIFAQAIEQNEELPTRKAYGLALAELAKQNPNLIILDGDLSDSTFSGLTQSESPSQFFNMFIAEQNMAAASVGLSKMGKKVYASTFAAFWTRAYDQIRIASLSETDLVLCGSHSGVSIGEDGASQMGLEDLAMLQAVLNTTILYPSDAISSAKLTSVALNNKNITYLKTSRPPLPSMYTAEEEFTIGGSKTLKSSDSDICAVIAAGVTVHEALKAYEMLKKEGIYIRVIDCYSIKPIDAQTLQEASNNCHNRLLTVEDHYLQGGLGDAVLNVFATTPGTKILKLGVHEHPHSGKGTELLDKYGISARAIVAKIRTWGKI
jgi:transketolase